MHFQKLIQVVALDLVCPRVADTTTDFFFSERIETVQDDYPTGTAARFNNARARVTKDRKGSGKLTVKLSWGVVGSQAVKRYSVMDLGRDSPVLYLQASIQLGQQHLEAIPCNPWQSGRDTTSDLGQNSTPPPLSSFVLQPCFFGSRCTEWVTRSVRISIIHPYTHFVRL